MNIQRLSITRVNAVYESEAFKSWKQARDNQAKAVGIIASRIDGVSKQLSGLAKLLQGR